MDSSKDEVAWGLEQELDALWRFALRLAANPDDAAELVQRTCLRALERRQNYKSQGKLRSWLFSIEHRIWLNELRSRQIRNHHRLNTTTGTVSAITGSTPKQDESQHSDDPERNVLLDQVYDLVEALPEAQKMVMLLVCVEGFSYRETAEILDVPVGTIMSRLARARVSIGQHVLNDTKILMDLGKAGAKG